MTDQKIHIYPYICPVCGTIVTGCRGIDCSDCENQTGECAPLANRLDKNWYEHAVLCECLPEKVIAYLICENAELQDELSYITEKYVKLCKALNITPRSEL